MRKPGFFVLIALLITTGAFAQSSIIIKGSLQDSVDKSAVAGARIDVFSSNDSSASAVTGLDGRFEIHGLHAGNFRVLINMLGYPLITKVWTITDSAADLGTLFISKASTVKTDSIAVVNTMPADSTAAADSSGNNSTARNRVNDTNALRVHKTDTSIHLFQGLSVIAGSLQDKTDKTALSGATVKLSSGKAATSILETVSNAKGQFNFENVPPDVYTLSVSYIDHDAVDRQVVTSEAVNNLGIILIPKKSKELAGVTIVAKTPPAQQKGDTVQYNASAFKVNPDATTEDLIKKMPGITVDKDGTVTAHGDQVKKVTIDGKDFLGDDATAALRNLPSEVVDKIQVFDKLSDQAAFTGFDDGNSVKSINIVTKSGIKNGQFGRVYAGYGTNSRYAVGGNVSTFNGNRRISVVGSFNNINQQNFSSQDLLGVTSGGGGGNFGSGGPGGRGGGGGGRGGRGGGGGFGSTDNFTVGQQAGISSTNAIGINYTDKWSPKLDMQASYFFNNSNNTNQNEVHTQTLLSQDSTLFSDQNSLSKSKNYNHRFNMRLEYKLDSFNSLIINPSLNFQDNNTAAIGNSQSYYGANDTANTSQSNTSSQRNGYNLRNNILFRHSFAKRGRTLSLNLNTTLNKNDADNYTEQHLRFFKGGFPISDSLQDLHSLKPTSGYTVSANIAYTEPVGKKGQLQFNYTPSWSKNKADQQTYSFDTAGKGYTLFKPDLSNKFDNTVTTNSGGITYRLGASRDNQFSVGASVQYSTLESMRILPQPGKVNQSFTNVLPNLLWRKKISPKSSVNIFYRSSTNVPSVTQLQDVVDPSNPLRVTAGNPYLKQAYTNFLSARYIFTNTAKGQSFFANIFLQTQSNYISNATYIAQHDSAIQQGNTLKRNSQLSIPVNLNGYRSLRSFFTFSQPISLIKSNVNLSTGFTYSRLPGLINYQQTVTNNYVYNAGVVIASNISQYVDFNLSYSANFNDAKSSANAANNQHYVNQVMGVQFNLLSKQGWFIQNDLTNQRYTGLTGSLNQDFWLWNASIGKKFLKNQVGELKLSAFDLLKQNQSIVRTVIENTIEDSRSNVLQQYFLLTFTYSLKNFGTGKAPAARPNRRFSPDF